MTAPSRPDAPDSEEAIRLARLSLLAVMDSEPEPIFDALTRMASAICGTPIALISLLDDKRLWFKSNVGLDGVQQIDRELAFCTHAIEADELMEVGDAQQDSRFFDNPLVKGEPGIRFYAGAPIVMSGGERLGTLCVVDRAVRHLTDSQRAALVQLAEVVSQALLLRERAHFFEVVGQEDRFKVSADGSPLGIFHADAKGRTLWTRSVGHADYEQGLPVRLMGALQEITAKKAVEEELRQANRLLQAVLENLPCGVSVFDGDMQLVAHNAQLRKLLDLPDSLFEMPVVTFESIVRYNTARGEFKDGLLESVVGEIVERARDPAPHHFQGTRSNGLTLDIRGAPMPGGGFVSTYVDISAARAAEAALRLSEERQHRAFVASGVVLWDFDLETGQVYLSENWADLIGDLGGDLGVTTSTTLQALLALVPQEDQLAIRAAFVPVLKGVRESYLAEHRVRKVDGSTAWVLSVGKVTLRDANGRALRASGTNRDVSARKYAQLEQQSAAAITSATLDATEDGILVLNDRRDIVLFNQRFLDMWHFPKDLVGGDNRELARFAVTQVKDPRAFMAKSDELYKDVLAESFDVLELKDGRTFERYSKPHRLDAQAFGRVWSFRDVTARRAVEAELKQAKDAAVAANRAKSAFLATMSHEIRTPLNGILGITQLLLDEPLSVQQTQFAQLIDSSAQSLLVLVDDFLDLAKIDAGKTVLEEIPFNLRRLLADVSELFGYRASAKSLLFRLTAAPTVPERIWGDSARLRQVLVNLLGNALKFTETGEVSLTVAATEPAQGQVKLVFSVADTGIGIASDAKARIFTNFMQADSSTTRKYGGTGLGLAIVKGLSELMGGRVDVHSVLGEGSTFNVTLDSVRVVADSVSANVSRRMAPTFEKMDGRILVVEDNPTNQIVAVGLLKKIGYEQVVVVGDGKQALEHALRGDFVAIFMDCQMPVMDGYVATQTLRAQACRTPIIAMTANASPGDEQRCLQAGMSDYLAKPVTQANLLEVLTRWVPRPDADQRASPSLDGQALPADRLPVFDRAGALARLGGDETLLDAVVQSFVGRVPEALRDLEQALQAGDGELVKRHLHSLIGAAAAVSADQAHATLVQMHGLAGLGDLAGMLLIVSDLQHKLVRFVAENAIS
jgi:signal transduction histidine kinase/HPt (histidine-containing phosphotransfer) domain-containing protein